MVKITSKRDGFRRCGIAHPKKPTEYKDNRFSEDELAILKAEPMLAVVSGDDEAKAKAKAEADAKAKAKAAKGKK